MAIELIVFGLINLLVCAFSGAAGGGGALITTPVMVLLGLTPAQAIATAKFNGFGVSLGTTGRFWREKLADPKLTAFLAVIAAFGALAGSLTLAYFKDQTAALENLMGLAILVVGIPTLYLRRMGLRPRATASWLKAAGLLFLITSAFMQAALSSGLGSLQMIILISCFGMTALSASATRRAMQLGVAIVSLTVFVLAGLVDYRFGLVGMFTALIGGYIGAHIAVKKGNQFVLNLFALASAILALQLILG